MKESYVEGLATHNGPESCGAAREGGDEALTGERAGRVFSRVIQLRDADAVRRGGRQYPRCQYRKVPRSPARSETPCTHGSTLRGNREIPCSSEAARASDRVGKSKDTRR